MAQVAKSGTPSLCSPTTQNESIAGLVAGEALAAFDAVYIKSDGKIWKSNGTSANAAAKVRGYAAQAVGAGEPITIYLNPRVRYGAGMTPGTTLFLSATAGTLSDAATTGGTAPIGFVVDATRVQLYPSQY